MIGQEAGGGINTLTSKRGFRAIFFFCFVLFYVIKLTTFSVKKKKNFKKEKKKIGRGCFESVYGRKARVEGDEGHTLAELQGWLISGRRCNVGLFLLGPVIDHSFPLMILLLVYVIDNSSGI